MNSRRNFLIIAGALGIMAGWRAISPMTRDVFAKKFVFHDIKGLEGFRKIDGGQISAATLDPFIGLNKNEAEPSALTQPLKSALHFRTGPGVPVSEFTDYNCPYCKLLSKRIHALQKKRHITRSLHHLPLLGEDSRAAAQVVLAASAQGNTDALHQRIMTARFRVDENYARATAQELGFDPDSFDLTQAKAPLVRAKTLANKFGIIGTPALVVGRTLVTGDISERRLMRLIEEEKSSI